MKEKKRLGSIIIFYVIAIIFRFLAVKTNLYGFIDNQFIQILLRGIGPAIGAFVSVKLFNIPLKLSLKGNYQNLFLPLFVFWIFPVVLIGTVNYIQQEQFPFALLFTVLVYGLLEEIGWRGFLQEQLKDLPKLQSIIIITVLWFIWHLNFEFIGSNMILLGVLFLGTWGIGKVYNRTYSLLAVAGFHSLNNFFRDGLHERELILITVLLLIWIGFMIWHNRKLKTNTEESSLTKHS